jgi:hypothetical protein
MDSSCQHDAEIAMPALMGCAATAKPQEHWARIDSLAKLTPMFKVAL